MECVQKNNEVEKISNEEQERIRKELLRMAKNSTRQTQIDFIAKRLEREMAKFDNRDKEDKYK